MVATSFGFTLPAWVGGAIADVLVGAVNPSGRLTETIPVRLEDSPAHLGFPGAFGHVRYGEDVFVGYRGYDARGTEVSFTFGHGLSYTDFSYGELSVDEHDGGPHLLDERPDRERARRAVVPDRRKVDPVGPQALDRRGGVRSRSRSS